MTSDALVILERMTGNSARVREFMAKERINLAIARQIYDTRETHGLSQQELADRVGTSRSVIARLEDADYRGHSLLMLRRIAEALDSRVEVRIIANKKRRRGAA